MKEKKVIFWDFEGTLVYIRSLWGAALVSVLDECEPGHCIHPERLRPYLKTGFPWHTPEQPHLHLKTTDDWWSNLETVFIRAYQGVGFGLVRSSELAKQVRKYVINPDRYFIFEDTIPVLENLRTHGWKHAILSNHIPELPDMVKVLGLSAYVDFCISSAQSGYEKPHPEAFRNALKITSNPDIVWMIGDNPKADIQGAEALGIPAILVRNANRTSAKYYAENLYGAVKIIESEG
jgi:putative hydrolase of the HAD superfamily